MSSLELTSFITVLANAIASNVSDEDVLALLAAIFTQLRRHFSNNWCTTGNMLQTKEQM